MILINKIALEMAKNDVRERKSSLSSFLRTNIFFYLVRKIENP